MNQSTPQSGPPLVELSHISQKYQTPEGEVEAIRDVSFSVRRGEFVSLVGPSGCGKSTLLSILAGWFSPRAGRRSSKAGRCAGGWAAWGTCCSTTSVE